MSERELIDIGIYNHYVRRDDKSQFKESDNVGRSLAQDVGKFALAAVRAAGRGDKGDQKR